MNKKKLEKVEKNSKKTFLSRDRLLWSLITVVLLAAAVANHYLQGVSFAIRVAVFIVLLCVLAVPAFFTTHGRKFWEFAIESRMELRKVVWPSRQETVRITMFVVGLVVVTALFMWGIDSLLLWLVGLTTN